MWASRAIFMHWKLPRKWFPHFRNNLGHYKGLIRLLTLAWWLWRSSGAGSAGSAAGGGQGVAALAGGPGPIRVCRHNRLQRVEHHAEDLQQHQQRHQHQVCPQVCVLQYWCLRNNLIYVELHVTVTTSWYLKTLTSLAVAVAQSAWVRNHQSGWKFWEIHKSQWSRCGELWLCL